MSAILSPCGRYRLRLDRAVDMFGGPTIGWCGHNPSTADGEIEDPTSRRMINFTKRWGGSSLVLVNTWAGRATKPADLWRMDDPVGENCDQHIVAAAATCVRSGGFMVAAWGVICPPAHLREAARARLTHVEALIRQTGCAIRALAVNADGSPKHPLYVRADAEARVWPAGWRAAE